MTSTRFQWWKIVRAPGHCINDLERGERRTINRYGKPVAELYRLPRGGIAGLSGRRMSTAEMTDQGQGLAEMLDEGAVVLTRYGVDEAVVRKIG